MKKYKTLLFDVDDTLLDFQKAEKVALRVLFEEKGIPLTDEIEARYKKINKGLWDAFEKGELSRNEVVNTRFSLLFKEYGEEVDGILFENNYRNYLEEGNQLMQGAFKFINQIQGEYELYIVKMVFLRRKINVCVMQGYIHCLKMFLFRKIQVFKSR